MPNEPVDTSDERAALDTTDKAEIADVEEITETVSDDADTDDDTDDASDTSDDDDETLEATDDDTTESERSEDEPEEDEALAEDEIYRALKKHDKDIFKKIPELRKVIFREQAFTQVFPTINHAKQAAQAAEVLEGYIGDITDGNSEGILTALGKMEGGSGKVEQFVANLIPTVEKHSKDLYLQMIYPEIKRLCRVFARSNDQNVANSALHLHNAVFGNINLNEEVGLAKSDKARDPKEDDLTKREQQLEQKLYTNFYSDVSSTAANRLVRKISAPFRDSGISDLQQKLLVKEIYDRVESQIVKDVRHMGNMNSLWDQARRNGYASEWKDRISNAYLSRATLLIPRVRQQVLAESKMSIKTQEDGKKRIVKRIPSSSSATINSSGKLSKVDKSKVDWNATDERAALDGKFIMKK